MKLAVIFGGRSSEHDISIITGIMVISAASVRHEVIPVYITREGRMITHKSFTTVEGVGDKKGKKVNFVAGEGMEIASKHVDVGCVINCCHGRGGEDGALSGMVEMSGLPMVGSGVRSSAVGMDKLLFKQLMRSIGLPVIEYEGIMSYQYESYDLDGLVQRLGFPLIVKPSNLGSSIGVGVARDKRQLKDLLDAAFLWDDRVLVEKALENFSEVNCAAFGFDDKVVVSAIEQPKGGEILSFDDKYLCGDKGGRQLPAVLSDEMRNKIETLTKQVFCAVGCSGIARVDFLIKDGIFVNEINTVPGSLGEYLFRVSGIAFTDLLDEMISHAFVVKENKEKLRYSYNSSVLCRNFFKK